MMDIVKGIRKKIKDWKDDLEEDAKYNREIKKIRRKSYYDEKKILAVEEGKRNAKEGGKKKTQQPNQPNLAQGMLDRLAGNDQQSSQPQPKVEEGKTGNYEVDIDKIQNMFTLDGTQKETNNKRNSK